MTAMRSSSQTALWTVAARARDARSDAPLCGDAFAARFVPDPPGPLVEALLGLDRPTTSVVVRHVMIDGLIREALTRAPQRAVVLLGAGFDSRAFRLDVGRFFELDRAEVLEHKQALLPAEGAARPLRRVPLDLGRDPLPDALVEDIGPDPLLVAEGLLMYLASAELDDLLARLAAAFPRHTLIADLLSAGFLARYAPQLEPILAEHGLRFATRPQAPAELLRAHGYGVVDHSVIAATPGAPPRLISYLFMPEMRRGNVVCVARRD